MTAGDARAEYDAMLRDKAARARHDPGDPGAGDPLVSRTIYALRDLRVPGPAVAEDVLETVDGHLWLRPEQVEAVLDGMRPQPRVAPVGPGPPELVHPDDELHDEGREDDPPGVGW